MVLFIFIQLEELQKLLQKSAKLYSANFDKMMEVKRAVEKRGRELHDALAGSLDQSILDRAPKFDHMRMKLITRIWNSPQRPFQPY